MRHVVEHGLRCAGLVALVAGATECVGRLDAGPRAGDAPGGARRVLAFVAHQDDDLLFLNPKLLDRLRAGSTVETVYVTAGDAGAMNWSDGYLSLAAPGVRRAHWQLREDGIRAAYAAMAGVANEWTTSTLSLGSKSAVIATLRFAPSVRLVFLRLPDGNVGGAGFDATCRGSLQKLWAGDAANVRPVDTIAPCSGEPATGPRDSYSREALIDVLARIIIDFGPDTIWTLDATGTCGNDHSDHRHAALFAVEAHHRAAPTTPLHMFRGYNIAREPPNVSGPAQRAKWEAFLTYAAFDMCKYPRPTDPHGRADAATCEASGEYHDWGAREYEVTPTAKACEPP